MSVLSFLLTLEIIEDFDITCRVDASFIISNYITLNSSNMTVRLSNSAIGTYIFALLIVFLSNTGYGRMTARTIRMFLHSSPI